MKKILFYRWKAYNYLDIRRAFERAGFEVREIKQKLENYDVAPEFQQFLSDELKKESYDFVFTVNYFAVIAEVCHDMSIPYVSWTCDNPLISMYHESVFYDTNFIFSFDRVNCEEFRSLGVKNIWYLPLAANSDRLSNALWGHEGGWNQGIFGNEVAFCGSLYERNTYDRIEKKLPDYLRGYFDGIMGVQADLYGSNILETMLTPDILSVLPKYFHLKKSEGSFSDLSLVFSTTVLGFKTAQIQRMKALLLLAEAGLSVSIYSNSDTSELIGVKYRGGLDYWTELPKCYKETKINLNFTIPNIKSGIPLRVFDIMGSGGFCLTNFQAEMPEYFKDGYDLVMFYSYTDMVEKAKYYLSHDTLRETIAQRSAQKIKEFHTVEKRTAVILDTLRKIVIK